MSQTFGNLKDLSRLMGGAVQERWEDALGRMTRNILDPNTEPRRARKITMVLTIIARRITLHLCSCLGGKIHITSG